MTECIFLYYAGEPAKTDFGRVYLMTICPISMSVVKVDKLTNLISKPKNSAVAENSKQRLFKKMFTHKQEEKVLIMLYELQDTILVFDCNPYFKHLFYFNTIQMLYTFDYNIQIAIKEETLYSIGMQGGTYTIREGSLKKFGLRRSLTKAESIVFQMIKKMIKYIFFERRSKYLVLGPGERKNLSVIELHTMHTF